MPVNKPLNSNIMKGYVKITAFKTFDGKIFESEQDAIINLN